MEGEMQLIEGTKGRRHKLVSIFNNMQTAESLKRQSVMLGGAADPAAFMTEVGAFQYEAFRCGYPCVLSVQKAPICCANSISEVVCLTSFIQSVVTAA